MKWGRGSGKGREMTTTETCSCYLAFINPAVFLPSSHSGALLHYGDLSFYGGTSHTEVYSSCGGSECGCMSARDTPLTHSPSSPGLCRRSNHGPLLPPESREGSRERYVQEAPRKSGSSRMGTPGALLIVLLLQATLGITGAKAPPENVETMATWTTQLPCRVRSTDTPQLVLWYRRHENHPFYSYDARNGNLSAGSGRVHDTVLGPRSQFLLVKKTYQPGPQDPPGALPVFPGWLELQQVTREDAGGFTCRVDFLDAPTQTHRLHLIVNEKPSTVMVVDGQGRTLPRGPSGVLVAGPFNQGSRPFLTCYVRGGWPVPSIEWVKGGVRLTNASTSVSGGDGSLTNRLYLPPLTAADYLTELQCVVTNNNLTEPIITSVRIDMNIKPASVLITGVESALETGRRQEVKCVSTGSRPPANLTWDLKGEADWSPLQVTQTVTRTGSSESRVVWAIQPGDNGRELSCTATNPRNPEYAVTNRTLLTVFHHPIVSLSIGRGLDPSSIKEGGDVYFTCSVTANPPPSGITFYHQGEEVQQGRRGAGVVLVTGDSLVLQKVGREGGGLYSCSAANARGNETSNVIHLHVLYAPQCEVEEQVVTVTPGENVTVVCAVDAYPPPDRFSWSLNSTQDGLHVVPQNEFEWSGNTSRFTYTTSVSLSKMMVLCWAMNTQGRTGHPCTTTLIPAGMPERVQSCTVVEQRISSLKVTCTPGFDGGLRQRFIATVLEPGDKRIVANVTADEPQFTLGGLAPGFDYVVKVFAFNSRGRSEPYILDGFSLKVAENRMDSGNVGSSQGASPLLALFIGVLAAFMLTLTVIIVATKLRCRVRASSRGGEEGVKSEESEDDDESRGGNERRSSAEEKLMTMRTPDCEERAKGTLSPPQHQQQQQQQLSQQPPQQIQQQQQQHFFGAHRSHDIGSPLDYTRLDSKTSDSLYSSCASNRCGIGYSTESAMLLSSSPSACSATIGMLVGPPCPSGADVPGVGSGPMMGIMYGSLGRSLGQTWGQYSSLSRPPPPAYDAEVGQRFHTLSAGSPCTRRPSESFV